MRRRCGLRSAANCAIVAVLACCETPAWALMGFDEYRKSCGPGRNIGEATLGWGPGVCLLGPYVYGFGGIRYWLTGEHPNRTNPSSTRPVSGYQLAQAATASTGIGMESWARAVVEAIHSSRSQAVIYLAGGASQV